MKELREYSIAFVGLKEGVHHFNYELDGQFFSRFEDSLVRNCHIFVDLSFDKKDRLFVLNFDIAGTIVTDCDRCGQTFDFPIYGNHTMYVKVGDLREEDEDNEEVTWIAEGESVLDVSEMIYEFVHLSIPIKKIHPDKPDGTSGCDPQIIKQLGDHSDENKTDPRWDILNKLNKN